MRIPSQVVFATVILVATFLDTQAQSPKDHLQKGDRFYERRDYDKALIHYLEALAIDPDDARTNYRAGISYLNNDNYSEAVGFLEKAYQLKSDVDADIDYYLGIAYQRDHQFSKARAHFETVRKMNNRLAAVASQKIRQCMDGDSLMRIPMNGEVKILGSEINSPFADFTALLTTDGNTLVFTSSRSGDGYEVKSGTNDENVYISRKASGSWSTPARIADAINVKLNEAATFLSADGKTLLLYYEDGGGDIYSSTLVDGHWSRPEALNKFVNHPHYRESSACLSPDGQRLYFSSNRPGGKGGFDLYVCKLGESGQWSRPTNLGSGVNTRGDEQWPFLHADGVTLYFSSNGWATLGDADIFRIKERGGNWSTPENLGYPINTSAPEGHFSMSPDNRTGYFTSLRKGGHGSSDIFTVSFSSPRPSFEDPDEDNRPTKSETIE